MNLFDRIVPARADNRRLGHPVALWILAAIVALRLLMGANSIINSRAIASGADGIPLASFNAAAQAEVIQMFALLGLYLVLLALVGLVVLLRYRALIPLVFVCLLVQELGSKLVLWTHPDTSRGASPGAIVTLVIIGLTVVGLLLSVTGKGYAQSPAWHDDP